MPERNAVEAEAVGADVGAEVGADVVAISVFAVSNNPAAVVLFHLLSGTQQLKQKSTSAFRLKTNFEFASASVAVLHSVRVAVMPARTAS